MHRIPRATQHVRRRDWSVSESKSSGGPGRDFINNMGYVRNSSLTANSPEEISSCARTVAGMAVDALEYLTIMETLGFTRKEAEKCVTILKQELVKSKTQSTTLDTGSVPLKDS